MLSDLCPLICWLLEFFEVYEDEEVEDEEVVGEGRKGRGRWEYVDEVIFRGIFKLEIGYQGYFINAEIDIPMNLFSINLPKIQIIKKYKKMQSQKPKYPTHSPTR